MPRGHPKLPPREVVAALIRFGFTYTDIADRFDVMPQNVTRVARELGFPPLKGGPRRPNGARRTFKYGDQDWRTIRRSAPRGNVSGLNGTTNV